MDGFSGKDAYEQVEDDVFSDLFLNSSVKGLYLDCPTSSNLGEPCHELPYLMEGLLVTFALHNWIMLWFTICPNRFLSSLFDHIR